MLSYLDVIERLKVINIVVVVVVVVFFFFFFFFCFFFFFFFFLSVFEIEWHEGLWICVYKGVKVKAVDGNAKSFLCVRERRSFETLNQIKQIVVLKH